MEIEETKKLFKQFIEHLNAMDLNNEDIYVQYSFIKNCIGVLNERGEEIRQYIIEDMEAKKASKVEFPFGKFTVFDSSEYEYSVDVQSKEKEMEVLKKVIKGMKELEEIKEVAKKVEDKKTLRFT